MVGRAHSLGPPIESVSVPLTLLRMVMGKLALSPAALAGVYPSNASITGDVMAVERSVAPTLRVP